MAVSYWIHVDTRQIIRPAFLRLSIHEPSWKLIVSEEYRWSMMSADDLWLILMIHDDDDDWWFLMSTDPLWVLMVHHGLTLVFTFFNVFRAIYHYLILFQRSFKLFNTIPMIAYQPLTQNRTMCIDVVFMPIKHIHTMSYFHSSCQY